MKDRLGLALGAYLNTVMWALLLIFLWRTPLLLFTVIGCLIASTNLSIWFWWLLREPPETRPTNLPGEFKIEQHEGYPIDIDNTADIPLRQPSGMISEETIERMRGRFAEVVSKTTDETVISTTCPKCGGSNVGYCVPCKTYECSACGFEWANRPDGSILDITEAREELGT